MLYFYKKKRTMKKIYLSIVYLASLNFVSAQFEQYDFNQSISTLKLDEAKNILSPSNFNEKALGQKVWSNDFSNLNDWLTDNSGQTAPNYGWSIGSSAIGDYFNPNNTPYNIKSTSKGNFAQVVNGASGSSVTGVTYTLTTKNPIDVTTLAGTGKVNLSFQQYGARFQDRQEVYISTNGTDFVKVGDNSDIPGLYAGSGTLYANPTLKTIDLSSVLSNDASKVWIRFSWTVNPTYPVSLWYAYGWMIDDVAISTKPDYDLIQKEVFFGSFGNNHNLSYYQIPTSQVHPIRFGAVVTNNGLNAQSDVVFNATTTGYSGKSEIGVENPYGSPHGTLLPSQTDTLWTSVPYMPPAIASSVSKKMTFSVTSSAIDDAPLNNGQTSLPVIPILITSNTFARDKGAKDGYYHRNGRKYEFGNLFDVFADQKLYSVDVILDAQTVVGSLFRVILYDFNEDGSIVEIDRSYDFDVVKGKPGTKVNLGLISSPMLEANKSYLVVVSTDGSAGVGLDLVIATSGRGFSIYKNELDEWYPHYNGIPMIRMNFLNNVGLSELKSVSSLNIYPNPANTSANVSFELNNETDINIAVLDLTGKTIYTNQLGNMNSGTHNVTINTDTLSNGIYIVNFEANGTTTSQKLVVKK
jgi:hypothetical protein